MAVSCPLLPFPGDYRAVESAAPALNMAMWLEADTLLPWAVMGGGGRLPIPGFYHTSTRSAKLRGFGRSSSG